jgi:hypothetical protein
MSNCAMLLIKFLYTVWYIWKQVEPITAKIYLISYYHSYDIFKSGSMLYTRLLGGGTAQCVPSTVTITDLLCGLIWFLIIPHSCSRALWQQSADTSGSEAGESWREMTVNFGYKVSLFIPVGFLTCCKILRHWTDGFTSPPKDVFL